MLSAVCLETLAKPDARTHANNAVNKIRLNILYFLYCLGIEKEPVPPSLSQVRVATKAIFFLPSFSTSIFTVRTNLFALVCFQLDALTTFTPSILNFVCDGATLQTRWVNVNSTVTSTTSPGRQLFLLSLTLKSKSHAFAAANADDIKIIMRIIFFIIRTQI